MYIRVCLIIKQGIMNCSNQIYFNQSLFFRLEIRHKQVLLNTYFSVAQKRELNTLKCLHLTCAVGWVSDRPRLFLNVHATMHRVRFPQIPNHHRTVHHSGKHQRALHWAEAATCRLRFTHQYLLWFGGFIDIPHTDQSFS